MMRAELQHADKVEGMFSEAMSDRTYLEHYGVQGMRWGVRKERESSGKGRKRSSSVKEVTSDQKKLSVGQKAVLGVVGAVVLRKSVGKIMKYGTRDGIARMKAAYKLEAKYGPKAVTSTATSRLGQLKGLKNKGFGAKVGAKGINAGAKAGKTAGKGAGSGTPIGQALAKNVVKTGSSAFQRAKNAVKNLLSSRASLQKSKTKAATKATKTVNKIKNKKAKDIASKASKDIAKNPNGLLARIKYNFETKKQVSRLERELPNKIGKLNKEADKAAKMSKLKNARAAQVADVHRRYDPALSKAAGRKGAATRAINEAEKKVKKKRR